jgi:hypothetical protein
MKQRWVISRVEKEVTSEELEKLCNLLDSKVIPMSWRPITFESFASLAQWKRDRVVNALMSANVGRGKYHFKHDSVIPADIHSVIDWNTVIGIEKSENGTFGVHFVEFANGTGLCVKVPDDVRPEVFGQRIAAMCGIRTASTKIVKLTGEEGLSILKALFIYQVKVSGEYWWTSELAIIETFVYHSHILLIEYVKDGIELASIYPNNLPYDGWLEDVLSSESMLRSLGGVAAMDLVIGNFDRFPYESREHSNPHNIFMDGRSAVAIDCTASWPTGGGDAQLLEERMALIRTYVGESLAAKERGEGSRLNGIRELIRLGQGTVWSGLDFDIGDEGSRLIQEGFLSTVAAIVDANLNFQTIADGIIEEMPLLYGAEEEFFYSREFSFELHAWYSSVKDKNDPSLSALIEGLVPQSIDEHGWEVFQVGEQPPEFITRNSTLCVIQNGFPISMNLGKGLLKKKMACFDLTDVWCCYEAVLAMKEAMSI